MNIANVKTIDLNGDGRLDLIAREVDKFVTYISNQTGDWNKAQEFVLNTGVFDLSSKYTFFSDLNGDGLVDLVFVRPQALIVLYNRGNGLFDEPRSFTFLESNPLILKQFFISKYNFLIDINGDGLADLVSAGYDFIAMSLNQGNSSFGDTYLYTEIHDQSFDLKGIHITSADINGDGNTDLLWTNDFHDYRYFSFAGHKTNYLTEIDNGLGGKTVVDYEVASNYAENTLESALPFPVKVVSKIEEYYGVANELLSKKTFTYSDGFYDALTNEFRGFRQVDILEHGDSNAQDLLTSTVYVQGKAGQVEYQKFIPLSIQKLFYDDSSMTFKNLILENYDNQTVYLTDFLGDRKSGFNYKSLTTITENDQHGPTSRSYKREQVIVQNSEGFITSIKNYVYLDLVNLERVEESLFALNNLSSSYVLDRICEKNIYDESMNKLWSEYFFYDELSHCSVSAGKITELQKWNGTGYETKKEFTYTSFGALATFKDSLNHQTSITYDSLDLNPISVTDAESLTIQATYDEDTSLLETYTDENNLQTSFYYDIYQRLEKVVGPADSTSLPTKEYQYTFGDVSSYSSVLEKLRINSGSANTFDKKTYFDTLGRKKAIIEEGETNKYTLEFFEYNLRGTLLKKYQKSFVSSFDYPSSVSGVGFFQYEVDALGRNLYEYNPQHLNPDPSYKKFEYRVGEVSSFDELSNESIEKFDVLKRVYERVDALSNSVLYEHDPLDQLVKITAPNSSETIFGHDKQKRRTCKLDPNVGLTLYSYNTEDLLTQKSIYGYSANHNGCTPDPLVTPRDITYEYTDGRNRLTKIDFPAGSGTYDIIFNHDEVASTYSKGKVSSIDFGVGTKKIDYDQFGNPTSETLTIDSNSYTTQKIFNVLGQLTQVIYPTVSSNSLTVDYLFNENNLIKQVKQNGSSTIYADNMTYSPLKQLEEINYGNNTKVTMSYNTSDQSYRLTNILSEKLGTPNVTIQNLVYDYDQVSNIVGLDDQLNSFVESYLYDDLYRLMSANIGGTNKSWSYDSIGNLQSKDGKSFSYHSTRKQIITSIDSDNYTFDDFGNLQNDQVRTYVFDWNNRLASMTKNSQTTEYFYAEDGIRVKKVAPSGTTYYLDEYTEITPSGVVRHIYAGEKLIASIDELGNITYNHQDHLGSSKLRTDDTGSVVKTIEHYPFGLKRVDSGSYNTIKFRFTSQYEDEESDLYYFKQRYYNPEIGRFISADPLYTDEMDKHGVNTQELNVYAYARNNPIKFIDSNGEKAELYNLSPLPHAVIRVDNPNSSTGSTYISYGPKDTSAVGYVAGMLGPVEGKLTITNSWDTSVLGAKIEISNSKFDDNAILNRAFEFKGQVEAGEIKFNVFGNTINQLVGDGKACNCIDAAYSIGLGGDAVKSDNGSSNETSSSDQNMGTNSYSQGMNENNTP